MPRRQDAPRDLPEITARRHPRGVRASARDRPRTWSTRSRRGASSIGWSATRSARCCGARCGRACPPVACSRSPCASSSSASARSRAFTAREYWTIEALLAATRRTARTFTRRARPTHRRRRRPSHRRRRDRRAPRRRACATPSRSSTRVATRKSKRNPAPPFTTAPCSRRPAASSASTRSGRCASPRTCTKASTRRTGRVGLITYMRTDSTDMAGVAEGEAREVIATRYGLKYTMPKRRASTRSKAKGAQEAHEAIRPTSFARDPDSLAGELDARAAAPLPADLAARAGLADGAPRSSRRPRST